MLHGRGLLKGGRVNMNRRLKVRWIFAAVFLVISVQLFMRAANDIKNDEIWGQTVYETVFGHSIKDISPILPYINGDWKNGDITHKIWTLFYKDMPLGLCAKNAVENNIFVSDYLQESSGIVEKVTDEDIKTISEASNPIHDNIQSDMSINDEISEGVKTDTELGINMTLEEAVLAENTQLPTGTFVPVQIPVATYSRQQLIEPGFIKKTFYTEDATTYIREDQLNYDTLIGFDAVMKQDNSNVQILVYHTHSQEAFVDSIPGDTATSIVGVGEHLCDILRTQYGFNVLHLTGEYDKESRDYAYSNAAVGLEKVLAENPTIEVMIDLHRDETNPNTKLITTVQDKTMAKFMFFNGLCYTRALGTLTNLPNPYVQDNISFAFQMQLAAEEYYPGLTRRIYLKGYRYNLHYRSKSLLIELGSQTNTVEEAMNSCDPLAHIISMVLNGENKQ